MPAIRKGRVYLAAPPADHLVDWLATLLRQHGFEPALYSSEFTPPISLTPPVAAIDLWRSADDQRFSALSELDDLLPEGRPLLTLCNAVSIDEIAAFTVNSERVVGYSTFGPAPRGVIVELLPGLSTSDEALTAAAALWSALGLITQRQPVGVWAVIPRLTALWINEAIVALADTGGTAESIDALAGQESMPLRLADEIGLGEILLILEALHAEYADARYRPAPLLRRMVLAGLSGRQTGRGFYNYD